nr:putative motility protein [Rhodoferax antarcticus]
MTATNGFRHRCVSPTALVNVSTQMQQSQVAQTAQVLVLKKAMDIHATCALALLQALPLATSGNLGTQVNTMA